MKKLLFVLAFAFIGSQAFSQIYIMTITEDDNINQCSSTYERTISKITPAGVETHICFDCRISQGALVTLNSEINSIVNQGYKLIETSYCLSGGGGGGGLQLNGNVSNGTTFIFAIP
jgi:hypothetical protein